MVVGGAVGGGAVGEVDGVEWGEAEGAGIEGDGGGVVFDRHGGVALGFEEFGVLAWGWGCGCACVAGIGVFGGGRGGGTAFGCTASSCSAGGGFSLEFFIDGVDA